MFEIAARMTKGSRSVTFIPTVNGERLPPFSYIPGGDKRRHECALALSKQIGAHEQLTVEHIEQQLAAKELAVFDELDKENEQTPKVVTAYRDDTIIAELVWLHDNNKPGFAIYNIQTSKVAYEQCLFVGEETLVPPAVEDIITPGGTEGAVLVPTEADFNCGDDPREEIGAFINKYVELRRDGLTLATEYVLLTWLYQDFDELPYLGFRTADIGRGKSRALDAVGSVCYLPLFVGGGSTAAATLRMLHDFQGTLVADEFDMKQDTELASAVNKILCQGFQKNRPLIKCEGDAHKPKAFRCFGPKLFAMRKRFEDDAAESRTIIIRMEQRTRKDIPLSLRHLQFDPEALALRNKLLAWRFRTLGKYHADESLANPKLEDRLNQIALPLLSIAQDDDTRSAIVRALCDQQADVAASRSDSLEGLVFRACLAVCTIGGVIRPGEVAKEVNRQRAEIEDVDIEKLRHPTTSQRVGRIIKDVLELPRDKKRDYRGARYVLDPLRVEQLKARYGDTTPPAQNVRNVKTSGESELFVENPHSYSENVDFGTHQAPDVSPADADVPGKNNMATDHADREVDRYFNDVADDGDMKA